MKRTLKYIGVGLLIVLGFLLGWGLLEPRFLDVEREEVAISELPEQWDGQRIAQVSDFQIGMWLDNPETAEKAVATIIEEDPAAVLLTGDFVYHRGDAEDRVEQFDEVAETIRPLVDAGIPAFAVLGNHDYSVQVPEAPIDEDLAAAVTRVLRRAGVKVLFNEAVALYPPAETGGAGDGRPLYLVGVGSRYANNDNVDKALADVPDGAPRIAMMHNPDTFELFPADTAPLAVAGHTHGGQIRLPGLPRFSYQRFAAEGEVHIDGWIPEFGAEGNRLYVSRGIGMSLVPLRINCMPAVTFITLHRAAEQPEPMASQS